MLRLLFLNYSKELQSVSLCVPRTRPKTARLVKTLSLLKQLKTIFEHYQIDVVETMPFLKNIERVEFYLDTQTSWDIRRFAISIKSVICDHSSHRLFCQVVPNPAQCKSKSNTLISYGADRSVHNSSHVYHVRHNVFDLQAESMPDQLREWTTEDKAVPWISLAARVKKPPASESQMVWPRIRYPSTSHQTSTIRW